MRPKVVLSVLGAVALLVAIFFATRPAQTPAEEPKLVIRISHFRPSIPATVQKASASLERKLAPHGVVVQWNEFKATTDSMLALSSGAIDISVGGVEGCLAAIASGVPMQILATGPHRAPKTGWYTAILVRSESTIRSLADLRGKKIAVGRGGFSEAILATAVRKGGARYPEDVHPVYLASAEATLAFTSGSVDAILNLDPYVPAIQRQLSVRVLTDNEQLGYPTLWNVAVNEAFAKKHPELVELIREEFVAVGPRIAGQKPETAAALAKVVGFDAALWETTLGRASYDLEPPSRASLGDVQYVADRLLELGVIRKPVKVAEHVLRGGERVR